MLSLVTVTDAGAVYDSGGLRGQVSGPLPFPHRVWHDVATDAIHFIEEPSFRSAGRHQTRVGDTVVDPADCAPMFLEGFAGAYRCLLDRRDALASASGPLRACAAAAPRVTPRPTNQYAMLSFVLAGPTYQRSGVARSTAVDVLHRPFAGYQTRPPVWPAVIEERRAIARLDVPYFSVRGDGTDLLSEGRVVVPGYFECSGLEAALARVHRLSERDLARQVRGLHLALGESCTARYAAAPPSAESPQDRAIEFAQWIAGELLRRADRRGDALEWPYEFTGEPGLAAHYLYQGTLGPVLLFAALAATTGDSRWRDHASATLVPLRRTIGPERPIRVERAGIGGAVGLGSIVYGLTVAGSLLKDATIVELAGDVAASLTSAIDSDDRLDVIDGAAGAALALLAHGGTTGRRDVLDQAVACGDHLIRRREVVGDGAAWRSPGGARLTGFAHGAAGIALALCRLFRASGEPRFGEAARLACRFVEAQFAERFGNYPIAAPAPGGAPGGAMFAWCHGAPGIVLGLCRELDILSKTAILSQFETALREVPRDAPAQVDHVCCGAFGRVEAAITAARAWGRVDLERAAWQLADDVGRRAMARGHFRLSGSGVTYRVYDPGFFRGLSGIGYQWLRLANPVLPSVAAFDPVPHQ
jgi:type 2 lantibiotic biosynthesis protein LanM